MGLDLGVVQLHVGSKLKTSSDRLQYDFAGATLRPILITFYNIVIYYQTAMRSSFACNVCGILNYGGMQIAIICMTLKSKEPYCEVTHYVAIEFGGDD